MSARLHRITMPENATSPWPWLPMSDDGSAGGAGGDSGDQGGDTGDTGTDGAGDGDAGTDDDGADALGDKGKQALDRMKDRLKTARAEAAAYKALGLSPDDIRALIDGKKGGNGDQPDPDKIRREAETAASKKAAQRIVKAEVRAAAAGKLADPADAYKFLDLDEFEVDDDGNVNEDDIADAIDDLVKKKPYLAVQDGRRFKGSADGGTRKEARPAQLTQSDLDRMSPDEIVKARQEGRLNDLLGITS